MGRRSGRDRPVRPGPRTVGSVVDLLHCDAARRTCRPVLHGCEGAACHGEERRRVPASARQHLDVAAGSVVQPEDVGGDAVSDTPQLRHHVRGRPGCPDDHCGDCDATVEDAAVRSEGRPVESGGGDEHSEDGPGDASGQVWHRDSEGRGLPEDLRAGQRGDVRDHLRHPAGRVPDTVRVHARPDSVVAGTVRHRGLRRSAQPLRAWRAVHSP